MGIWFPDSIVFQSMRYALSTKQSEISMGNPLELRSLSLAMNINHTQNKCTLYSLLVDTVSAREILIRYVRTKFEM